MTHWMSSLQVVVDEVAKTLGYPATFDWGSYLGSLIGGVIGGVITLSVFILTMQHNRRENQSRYAWEKRAEVYAELLDITKRQRVQYEGSFTTYDKGSILAFAKELLEGHMKQSKDEFEPDKAQPLLKLIELHLTDYHKANTYIANIEEFDNRYGTILSLFGDPKIHDAYIDFHYDLIESVELPKSEYEPLLSKIYYAKNYDEFESVILELVDQHIEIREEIKMCFGIAVDLSSTIRKALDLE